VIAISRTRPDNEVRKIPENNNLRLIDVGDNPWMVKYTENGDKDV